MITLATASSRVSQRLLGARTRRQAGGRGFGQRPSSLGQALVVGLGCDGYKTRQH